MAKKVSGFKFSRRSKLRLKHVHPNLRKVTKRALELSEVDFGITCGARSYAEQRRLFKRGATRIMNSRHLQDKDGIAYAVDVAAYVDGRFTFDWAYYFKIAEAFREAAKELGVSVRWGGVWDMELDDIDLTAEYDMEDAQIDYVTRFRKKRRNSRRKTPFLDGPHFELPRAKYPGRY